MLHIATVATHSERYLPVLDKMVQDKGLKLHKLGFGKKYSGHFMKDLEMIEFLKGIPKDDIVIFLDGFDTLMFSNTEEILQKFKEKNKKMIISVENVRNSFLTHSYSFQKVHSKFINTGLYMGYAGYILTLLKTMYSQEYSKKSNQATWSKFLNSSQQLINLQEFGIDSKSEIFLNHSFTCNNTFTFDKKEKRLIMKENIKPCFMQGNGVVNMDNIIKNLNYDKYNIHKKDLFKEQIKYSYNSVMKTYPILRYFISGIILVVIYIIFIFTANYKLKKFETYNLTFS